MVTDVDPGYRDVQERAEDARKQQQIARLQAEVRRLHQTRQWASVVKTGRQLYALDPAAADPDGLVTSAQAKLQAAELPQVRERLAKSEDMRAFRDARSQSQLLPELGQPNPRLLGGRYELDGVVGRGGMAEVYRARDIRLDRIVAIKTLRTDLARDQRFQARFRREAQSAASLNHPTIVAVYDTGEDIASGVPVPYIVMEYVDGRTVRDLLQEGQRLLPERSLEIIDGVLRALDYSHQPGIVHRDIKPGNVMVTRNGDIKVKDLGFALAMSDAQATMTQTAQVIGTPIPVARAGPGRADRSRSDLYSTGCLLYELLTGRPPFTGDSPVAIAYQHVRENPVPPSRVDPDVPPWADVIVLKAMAKAPGDRYRPPRTCAPTLRPITQAMRQPSGPGQRPAWFAPIAASRSSRRI